jgi:hypothetical protein
LPDKVDLLLARGFPGEEQKHRDNQEENDSANSGNGVPPNVLTIEAQRTQRDCKVFFGSSLFQMVSICSLNKLQVRDGF